MERRQVLQGGMALAAAAALPRAVQAAPVRRVRPGGPGWPSADAWAGLKDKVGGRLAPVSLPDLSGPEAHTLLANPFYIADQVGLTETSGWLDAWRSSPSAYAVTAESTADVVAAVNFAREHNLRLVIKGRGHSYLGASNAPDSLLIWTRHMDEVTVHDAFTPQGSTAAPVPAVSVGAGAMWLHAYQAVTGGAGRYVQGGGCTTVGVAGLVQGGGFGSFSKGFGTAAASLIEAEIVTADGRVRVVNHVQAPDLYWALKGGGGGTFGVITRLTLATHDLPATFGEVAGSIHARSDEAYRRLIARFVDLNATNLSNAHWGEQVHVGADNRLEISMVSQGLSQDEARAAWKPLIDFANDHKDDYEGQDGVRFFTVPSRLFWNSAALSAVPGVIDLDKRPEAHPGDFWWSGDASQVGVFLCAYQSAWLPADLLRPQNQARLVDALFAASRHGQVQLHFNKGLAGAPPEAIAASRDTATNPEVLDAFALAIVADGLFTVFGGGSVNEPAARATAARVDATMDALRVCAPGAGAYINECDYFQKDWRRAFWGPHYERLVRVKRRYDPAGLFFAHHTVGSEDWSTDGFTRVAPIA